ncbi:E3 ubiquitin- protein ligase [Aspergillus nanangensis]|uniref:E3 ubiquitin- protein ligase n=1 Tax=Aspergillus nanangensis TaxID=2582783 RepID=A0AAD4CW15_ASPNN|nr:E3 ubiquitin- protein ligase [Aspergillus nanangensis]
MDNPNLQGPEGPAVFPAHENLIPRHLIQQVHHFLCEQQLFTSVHDLSEREVWRRFRNRLIESGFRRDYIFQHAGQLKAYLHHMKSTNDQDTGISTPSSLDIQEYEESGLNLDEYPDEIIGDALGDETIAMDMLSSASSDISSDSEVVWIKPKRTMDTKRHCKSSRGRRWPQEDDNHLESFGPERRNKTDDSMDIPTSSPHPRPKENIRKRRAHCDTDSRWSSAATVNTRPMDDDRTQLPYNSSFSWSYPDARNDPKAKQMPPKERPSTGFTNQSFAPRTAQGTYPKPYYMSYIPRRPDSTRHFYQGPSPTSFHPSHPYPDIKSTGYHHPSYPPHTGPHPQSPQLAQEPPPPPNPHPNSTPSYNHTQYPQPLPNAPRTTHEPKQLTWRRTPPNELHPLNHKPHLPEGWDWRLDNQNRLFYVDTYARGAEKRCFWHPPKEEENSPPAPGWERVVNVFGRIYWRHRASDMLSYTHPARCGQFRHGAYGVLYLRDTPGSRPWRDWKVVNLGDFKLDDEGVECQIERGVWREGISDEAVRARGELWWGNASVKEKNLKLSMWEAAAGDYVVLERGLGTGVNGSGVDVDMDREGSVGVPGGEMGKDTPCDTADSHPGENNGIDVCQLSNVPTILATANGSRHTESSMGSAKVSNKYKAPCVEEDSDN